MSTDRNSPQSPEQDGPNSPNSEQQASQDSNQTDPVIANKEAGSAETVERDDGEQGSSNEPPESGAKALGAKAAGTEDAGAKAAGAKAAIDKIGDAVNNDVFAREKTVFRYRRGAYLIAWGAGLSCIAFAMYLACNALGLIHTEDELADNFLKSYLVVECDTKNSTAQTVSSNVEGKTTSQQSVVSNVQVDKKVKGCNKKTVESSQTQTSSSSSATIIDKKAESAVVAQNIPENRKQILDYLSGAYTSSLTFLSVVIGLMLAVGLTLCITATKLFSATQTDRANDASGSDIVLPTLSALTEILKVITDKK